MNSLLLSTKNHCKSFVEQSRLSSSSGLSNNLDALNEIAKEPLECLKFKVEDGDFYQCLSALVNAVFPSPSRDQEQDLLVFGKISRFFINIASVNIPVARLLAQNAQLSSSLFLRAKSISSGLGDTEINHSLRLLKIITCHCPVENANDLIPYAGYLCSAIVNIRSGDWEKESTSSMFGILRNLCWISQSFLQAVFEQSCYRLLCKKCSDALTSINTTAGVCAMSVLYSLEKAGQTKQMVFNEKNVKNSFQFVFNVVHWGRRELDRHFATDLLMKCLTDNGLAAFVSGYKHFPTSIQDIVHLFKTLPSHGSDLLKIYELISFLLTLDSLNLKSIVCDSFFRLSITEAVTSAGSRPPINDVIRHASGQKLDAQPRLCRQALSLLRSIIKLGNANASNHFTPAVVVPVVQSNVGLPLDAQAPLETVRVMTEAIRFINAAVKSSLVNLTEALPLDALPQIVTLALHRLEHFVDKETSTVYSELLVASLSTLKDSEDRGHQQCLNTAILDYQDMISCIVAEAIFSGKGDYVQDATEFLSLRSLPTRFHLKLCEQIAKATPSTSQPAMDNDGSSLLPSRETELRHSGDTNNAVNSRQRHSYNNNSNNNFFALSNGVGSNVGYAPEGHSNLPPVSVETVDSMIAGFRDKLEVRDPKISELIALYERKIAALESSLANNNGLLDARNAAMRSSDDVMMRYRKDLAESKSEATGLRSIIHDLERKCEGMTTKSILMQQENTDLMDNCRHLKRTIDEMHMEHSQWEMKLTEQQKTLALLNHQLTEKKQELVNEIEFHEVSKKQFQRLKTTHDSLVAEKQKMTDQIANLMRKHKDLEAENKNHCEMVVKLENDLGDKQDELVQLEKSVEDFQETCSRLEAEKSKLRQQVKALNVDVEELKKENDELRDFQKKIVHLANREAKNSSS